MIRLFVLLALIWAPLGSVALAQSPASPKPALESAKKKYERGAYKAVIALLRPMLYPKNRFSAKDTQMLAHKMLGVSYVFEKNRIGAEQSFMAILAEDPRFRLDPLVDPPAAVKIFEAVRKRSADMLRKIEDAQRAEARRQKEEEKRRARELEELKKAATRRSQIVERNIVRRPYWLNFIPFGVGQFQNGHRVKGTILLAAQIATAGASLGMALGYRVAFPDGRYHPEDKTTVDVLRVGQVLSGVAFWALVVYGVLDALSNHEAQSVTERRYQQSLRTRISPLVAPGSLGLRFTF